ncbi:type VII secretion protein EccCa [Saccharopolyspora sp. NPDC002376]
MGTTQVRRPARLNVPDPGVEPIVVAAPPQQSDAAPQSTSAAMIIMPLVSGSGSLLITLTNQDRPLFAAAGMLFLIASVALGVVLFIGSRSGPRKRMRLQRERYLDYLEDLRRTLREIVALQRDGAAFRHPDPHTLLDVSRLPQRRWERRATSPDFLELRIGGGPRPLARPLNLLVDDSNPLVSYDPVSLGTAQQLVTRYESLADQPVPIRLAEAGCVSIVGDREAGRRVARALVGQLVAFHSPDDVRLAVVRHERFAEQWDWAKWLPHALDDSRADGPVPVRLISATTGELAQLLADELEHRREDLSRRRGKPPGPGTQRLVVVVDGEAQPSLAGIETAAGTSLADLGIHLICLLGTPREEPERVDLRVEVVPDGTARIFGESTQFRADGLSPAELSSLGRELAPLVVVESEGEELLSSTVGLADVLGVPDVAALDTASTWRPRPMREFLRVPIGIGVDGHPVMLDLKESAFGGMGPHGLVVGATGSGKSEMLRTLVSSLIIGHSPDRLALLLVDFKGGATFAGMRQLPHLAGMITNLADDLSLVDRFRDALDGEMLRRQQLLSDASKQAGVDLPNVDAYEDLRATGAPLEPLPHLLVIIDEFSELLSAKPEFADLFVAVGRIGRSIGVHLLLATQRLESGKIRGLESHLSYRIGLRTFSEGESRDVIGVPDAYHLPPEPGSGYLKVDTSVFERFKAALVTTPYRPPRERERGSDLVVPYTATNGLAGFLQQRRDLARKAAQDAADQAAESDRTVLQVAVQRLVESGARPVRQVWVDPLPSELPLDRVLDFEADGAAADPQRVTALLGIEDIPAEQRQQALEWDFTGAEGNLVVLGAPQTGKSTLVRSMVASMSLRYAPGQVAFFCVDYGGGTLVPFEQLPHVAAVATRADPDRVRRTISDVQGMLDERERMFRAHGLDSAAELRRRRAAGDVPPSVFGDVFLVLDGWGVLRESDLDLEEVVMDIAGRGPALGVHTVLTANAGNQVRVRLASSFGGRLELRLNDPFESHIDRRAADELPKDQPGRVLVPSENYAQVALPRIDGNATTDDLTTGVQELIAEVAGHWPDGAVPVVQVLPERVELRAIPGHDDPNAPGLVLGLSERDLSPARLDLFGHDPHLQIYGDPQTGKSTLVSSLLTQLTGRMTSSELGIVLVDYRRTHLEEVPEEYLLSYCTSAAQTAQVVQEVCTGLQERMPGPDVTPQQLRNRSWWDGLEVVVVVDDYDLVSTTSGNPLAPLAEFAPQGRDLGLHLVLARRTGGAARFLFEPLTQSLSDMGSPGVLFSGDRMEGRLINATASRTLPAGRALLARRSMQPVQIQTAIP